MGFDSPMGFKLQCRVHSGMSCEHKEVRILTWLALALALAHVTVDRGYVQGGSDGMPILGDFAVKYGTRASELGVPIDDLYQALVDTAENTVCTIIT